MILLYFYITAAIFAAIAGGGSIDQSLALLGFQALIMDGRIVMASSGSHVLGSTKYFWETNMTMRVYLSGEIHTDWRDQIIAGAAGLDVVFSSPVTDHAASDDCGVAIMGAEDDKFWHDNKGARLNAIRTRKAIADADVVVVRFGEKYRQWNAAFDAGYASALGKSLIIMHGVDYQHALKEVDAAALAVTQTPEQIVQILRYVQDGTLPS